MGFYTKNLMLILWASVLLLCCCAAPQLLSAAALLRCCSRSLCFLLITIYSKLPAHGIFDMHGRSIFYYSQLNVQYLCKHDKMVKVDVDHRKDSLEDVAGMFKLWKPESQLAAFKTLRGGYSGTNYLVETDTGEYFVIKIAHGYSIDEVEEQAKIGEFLKLNNFAGCCYPLEVANIQADHRFVAMIDETEPALLLNYLPGRAADFLIENGKLNHKDALIQIGYNLALMHLLPIDQGSCLRTHHHDGICFLHKHLNGEYYRKFTESDDNFIKNHDFSKFYVDHYDWLIECFSKCDTFQQSVVHRDPFLDNVLFDETTGKFL